MKRLIKVIMSVLICVLFLSPVNVNANTYRLSDTDVSLSLFDGFWYVFTRDNLKDNKYLNELGVSYEFMYNVLHDNNAYMDAIMFYENGDSLEFFVRKKPLDLDIVNLSNYDHDYVLELAKEAAKKLKSDKYSTYSNTYKFAQVEYFDSDLNLYVCDYITIVNKDNYTFTFQSNKEFDDDMYSEIEFILNTIAFDIDETLQEPKTPSLLSSVLSKAAIGAVAGGIAGAIIAVIKKRKK